MNAILLRGGPQAIRAHHRSSEELDMSRYNFDTGGKLRKLTRTRSAAMVIAATTLLFAAAACSSSDDKADNTSTTAATQDQTGENTVAPTVDQQAGGFQLTTADGMVDIGGTASACTLIDETSAKITFSGSTQMVNVDASGGTGSVTVDSEFDGTIETAAIDMKTGTVRITGTAAASTDGNPATEFTVTGTCEL